MVRAAAQSAERGDGGCWAGSAWGGKEEGEITLLSAIAW